jgi:hypothetical protein
MENTKFHDLWKFEEYEDVGGINGDESSTLPHARGHGINIRMPRQHVKHARMQNEVRTVFSKRESSGLDTRNIDDEGDEEGIGGWNSMKFLYYDSTWNKEHFTNEPKLMEFMGVFAPNVFWYQFSSFSQLFELFWLFNLC